MDTSNPNRLPKSGVRYFRVEKGCRFDFIAGRHEVILVDRGILLCFLEGYTEERVGARQLLFIRMGLRCYGEILQETTFMLIRLEENDLSSMDNRSGAERNAEVRRLNPSCSKTHLLTPEGRLPLLAFNRLLSDFMDVVKAALRLGCFHDYYSRIKIKEFLFLMEISYSYGDRCRFFESIINSEDTFTSLVYNNWNRVSSISHLAKIACYSLPNFERKFQKKFGMPPSLWIAQQKAASIRVEIYSTDKTFKQISFEQGFSSPAHFSNFCKKHLGDSPSNIRRSKKIENRE